MRQTETGRKRSSTRLKVEHRTPPLARLVCAQLAFTLMLGVFAVAATACEGGGGGGGELTSLSTKLSGGGQEGETLTVSEGTKVKDKATLTGKDASKATGKVTYKVYSDKECKTLVTSAGEVTVSGENVPASTEEELEAGKTYYWQAHYGGDSNNAESTSPCTEILNVQAKTTLSTKLSGESKEAEELTVIEGAKAKDTATLSGTNSSTATGKVVYKIYSDKECKTLLKEAGEVTLETGAKIPPSAEEQLEAGKTYYWQATYKGDTLHKESTSTCGKEILNVQAKTTLSTKLSGESKEAEELTVEEEQPVHDTATLTGTNSSTATGKVTYKVYADDECKELLAEAGEVTLETGGKVPSSLTEKFASDPYYYWQAVYSGDSLHQGSTSTCGTELELVADKTTLTTSLKGEASSEKITEGATVEVSEGAATADTATLHGKNASFATGNVTYDIYSDSECKNLVLELDGEPVSGEIVPTSISTILSAGTYYWQAVYSGDTRNQPSTSSCGSETSIVNLPPLTTSLSGESKTGEELEVQESAEVSDTATLHAENPSTATGTVTYSVYSNPECTELVANAGKVTLESGGKIPPSTKEKLATGTYYWQAVYSGDSSHKQQTSSCGPEFEVVADTTSITSSLKGEEKSGETIEVREHTHVTDTATLHGTKVSMAGGTLNYNVYSDSKCEHIYAEAGEVPLTGGSVPASIEESLPPGTYYWQAEYFGDSADQPSTETCGAEVETVSGLTTELSGGGKINEVIEVPEATPVSDVATLHSSTASTATGTVEYSIYSDSKCEHLVESAGDGTMKEGVATASEEKTLSPGTYYWQAFYKGDSNHPSQRSACGEEEETVAKAAATWVVSLGDSYISGEGGRWAGNTMRNLEWRSINALGNEAYSGAPNEEWKPGRVGLEGEEEIPLCHRSKSAEIFLGNGIKSKNLACSGAETTSVVERPGGINVLKQPRFVPGLDEVDVKPNGPMRGGKCPLTKNCVGQVKKLEEFAKGLQPGEKIKMVVISIGGNDFEFGPVVKQCVEDYSLPLFSLFEECHNEKGIKKKFEEAKELKAKETAIEGAINKVGAAMAKAGYLKNEYTMVVQDYPSPVPANKAEFRYAEKERSSIIGSLGFARLRARGGALKVGPFARQVYGACPFYDKDAEWANNTAQKAINETVKNAYLKVKAAAQYQVAFMQLEEVFSPNNPKEPQGRRLCEKGLTLVGGEKFRRGNPSSWLFPGPLPTTENETEWINQVRIRTYMLLGIFQKLVGKEAVKFEIQEDFHPNYWGQLALRNCLRKEYNTGAPGKEGTCKIEKQGLVAPPVGLPKDVGEPFMELTQK